MMKRTTLTSLLALIAVAGCNGGGDSTSASATTGGATSTTGSTPPATGTQLKIAVIPKGSTHEYWKSVHEGANTAAKELGNVTIDWQAPQQEDDREAQIKIVEDCINKQENGIVLAPLDKTALAGPVKEAAKANIPVDIIDSGLDGADFVSFIATDNEKGGKLDADELSKELGGKGKVIMLRYEEGSASTEAREKGFMEEIAKSPGITVVSFNQYGGATIDTAQKASENLLQTHRKGDGLDIDGIYTPNESTTFGMLRTLEGMKVAGKVKFVGFDASEPLIAALNKGEINALVIQNPRQMGYMGVKTIVDAINKKTTPKTIDTGATLITKTNIAQPEIAKLIAPPKVD